MDKVASGSPDHRIFFHGTSLIAAEAIVQNGFKVWFDDRDLGRYSGGGNLGTGIYVTRNWRIALWFGPTLLQLETLPGTRLLNSALPPDPNIIEYLQREFGREILRKTPWKVLPRNKSLTQRELISLFRYHYGFAWEKEYSKKQDGIARWSKRRKMHFRLLDDFKNILVRYGFDGYGNPEDDNGIIIFAEDKLIVKSIVVNIPPVNYTELSETDFGQFQSLEKLIKVFRYPGSG